MESIELLQRLVDAVEKSGADIAPTYQEYMSMAFAIANSCGEQGRTYFHRLCRISEKYRPTDADKLYNNALKDGHRKNSLGSVWHLAEQAGVTIDMNLAILQRPSHTPTRTYARGKFVLAPAGLRQQPFVGEAFQQRVDGVLGDAIPFGLHQ